MNAAIGALGVCLVLLKVMGYISLSWWFVLMPFYIGIVIFLLMFLIPLLGAGTILSVAALIDWINKKKRK